jgi:hypothetical protein
MKVEGKVDGRRFTKAKTVFYDNIDELKANQKTQFQEMDEARSYAEKFLERRGQPNEPKLLWQREDGTEFTTWLDAFIEQIFHRDSMEWYAAKIICAHERLIHSKTGKEIAAYAFQLGLLVAFMRSYQMLDVGSSRGGKQSKKKQWLIELIKILKEENPGKPASFYWRNFKNQVNKPFYLPECGWEVFKIWGNHKAKIAGRPYGTIKETPVTYETFRKYFSPAKNNW